MDLLVFAAVLGGVSAMPSYIAVPADQIAFLDLRSLRRVPRQILEPPLPPQPYEDDYQPIPIEQYRQPTVELSPPPLPARIEVQPASDNSQAEGTEAKYDERPKDFGEYVDFGAHTGDNGAFGWYADYPISNHGSGYRK